MKSRLIAAAVIVAFLLTLSRAEPKGQEYIVALKGGQSVDALNKAYGTRTLRQVPDTPIYLIQGPDDDADEKTLKQLRKDKGLDIAEKNRGVRMRSADQAPLSVPLVQQMASLLDGETRTTFNGTNVLKAYVEQPALQLTRVNDVRSLSTGAATRIAYIDTGVDFDHPALRPWLEPGVDLLGGRSASELDGLSQQMASLIDQQMASLLDKRFSFVLDQAMASLLDGDGAAFPSELGHGTLVAGVLHVVAPDARIVPIKAFDADGNTTMFTLIEAVYRAKDLDVDVLNMSFSTSDDSDTFRKAIREVQAAGVSVVASAGNDAADVRNVYPSSYPGVTSVAATDFNDRLASFSNYGRLVSVTAPGAFVISTAPGGKYAAAWGTSFSAPVVAGAIALIGSVEGRGHSMSPTVINAADFIDNLNPGFEKLLGKGRLNVQQALKRRN